MHDETTSDEERGAGGGGEGRDRAWVPWVVAALVGVVALMLWPVVIPLLLASWFATLARPWVSWLAARLGGRQHAAALLTLGLFVVVVAGAGALGASVVGGMLDLLQRSLHAGSAREAVAILVGPEMPGAGGATVERAVGYMRQHGDSALGVLALVGAGGWALLNVFLFFLTSYVFLLEGRRVFAWLVLHSPLSRRTMSRLGAAVTETGRGLLTSVGLTGLTQGVLTTIIYTALGVPRPLLLGVVTCLFAVVPVLGTPMIWVPVTVGLALTGHTTKALVMAGLGSSVMFFVDNVVGPWFARFGRLQMPMWLIILSIFGGVATLGPWGVLLGPLCVRLTREGLAIARDRGLVGPAHRPRSAAARPRPARRPTRAARPSSLLHHPGDLVARRGHHG